MDSIQDRLLFNLVVIPLIIGLIVFIPALLLVL